jgi:hypothetical protein
LRRTDVTRQLDAVYRVEPASVDDVLARAQDASWVTTNGSAGRNLMGRAPITSRLRTRLSAACSRRAGRRLQPQRDPDGRRRGDHLESGPCGGTW